MINNITKLAFGAVAATTISACSGQNLAERQHDFHNGETLLRVSLEQYEKGNTQTGHEMAAAAIMRYREMAAEYAGMEVPKIPSPKAP